MRSGVLAIRAIAVSVAFGTFTAMPARAQCGEWDARFAAPDLDGTVHAFTVFDDGSGSALYAGGEFVTAGGIAASRVAKWDGVHWSVRRRSGRAARARPGALCNSGLRGY